MYYLYGSDDGLFIKAFGASVLESVINTPHYHCSCNVHIVSH